MKLVVLDNYDSFVFNVARYLTRLGAKTIVLRNDRTSLAEIEALDPEAIVVSPGPCSPREAGISCDLVRAFSGRTPILGICLGHQVIGDVFSGRVTRALRPMHGRASPMLHEGANLFAGLRPKTKAGRYHSLIVEETPTMLEVLSVDARSPDGEIMALSHRTDPTFGVQFHPESILTEDGEALLANFIARARAFHSDRETEPNS
ncbi:aminodeoxychorismate synthase, glutamine amidotransferase subunit [Fulvimarina manganoxydans]|uniref:Aminodeoxychorismate synthase, glutamine amidotransferase subunit n=1 Tax=Fulvimarina manganoxydans TaxID=937218 RepID=A0A1W2AWH9_9HYPH|nr:aminodeoxychorismate/anthranilate synthase component II [Fulvimarina manganoxydans]SMC65065.1 aminodeoxychorismate synthase, glutamine amidotransferase subunit [Fulvimarina manganoxydans]